MVLPVFPTVAGQFRMNSCPTPCRGSFPHGPTRPGQRFTFALSGLSFRVCTPPTRFSVAQAGLSPR